MWRSCLVCCSTLRCLPSLSEYAGAAAAVTHGVTIHPTRLHAVLDRGCSSLCRFTNACCCFHAAHFAMFWLVIDIFSSCFLKACFGSCMAASCLVPCTAMLSQATAEALGIRRAAHALKQPLVNVGATVIDLTADASPLTGMFWSECACPSPHLSLTTTLSHTACLLHSPSSHPPPPPCHHPPLSLLPLQC